MEKDAFPLAPQPQEGSGNLPTADMGKRHSGSGGGQGAALGVENPGSALEWRALAEPCRVGCTEIAKFETSRGLSRKEAQHKPKPHGGHAHSPQATGQFVWRKRLSRVLSCEHRYVVYPSQLYCLMSTGSAQQSPVADPGKLATGER